MQSALGGVNVPFLVLFDDLELRYTVALYSCDRLDTRDECTLD